MNIRYLIPLLLLLWSCNGHVAGDRQVCFRADCPADSVKTEYEVLSLPEDIFLTVPDQLECDSSYIYLLYTLTENSGVYVFDKSTGDFVVRIGRKGRGKGECILPLSFTLSDDSIYLIDGGPGEVLRYDKATFEYDCKMTVHRIGCFEETDNGMRLLDNSGTDAGGRYAGKSFVISDKDFSIIDGKVDKLIQSGYQVGPVKPMFKFRGEIIAYTQFSPFVFSFDGSEMKTKYSISFDGMEFPSEDYIKKISSGNKDYTGKLRDSGYISYFDFFETDRNLLSMCMAVGRRYVGIYSKESGMSCLLNEDELGVISRSTPFMVSGVMDEKFAVVIPACDIVPDNKLPPAREISVTDLSSNDLIIQLISL